MARRNDLLEAVEEFQNLLVSYSTGGGGEDADYKRLRERLLNEPRLADQLPRFVRTCRDLFQYWQFIKYEFRSYAERREFLWSEFRPILESLERGGTPAESSVGELLARLSAGSVHEVWERALDRRADDPEGAITTARTLLETVCKHILDDLEVTYSDDVDLPKLYRLTSEALNIAPSQHTETIFKQILGGCTAVVEGLGALRNRLGDAHGKGTKSVKPAPRHAQLAVNLAGAMATFLYETWDTRKKPAG